MKNLFRVMALWASALIGVATIAAIGMAIVFFAWWITSPREALAESNKTIAITSNTTGTVTLALQTKRGGGAGIVCYTFNWTSDASGDADAYSDDIQGTIERVVIVPSTSAVPTDSYDMTLTDQDSIDVLNGQGADLNDSGTSNTLSTVNDGTTYAPTAVIGRLTLAVDNAGASKSGVLRLYARR